MKNVFRFIHDNDILERSLQRIIVLVSKFLGKQYTPYKSMHILPDLLTEHANKMAIDL